MAATAVEEFIGRIIMFAGNFVPRGWAFCNGQLLAISSNEPLFSILGTMYGGDGRKTFGLPDLRGRVPVHSGNRNPGPGLRAIWLGEKGGREVHTLTPSEMPTHNHPFNIANGIGNKSGVGGKGLRALSASTGDDDNDSTGDLVYIEPANFGGKTLADGVIGMAGGSAAFGIRSPYLGINFIICLEGIFPPRS